LERVAKPLVSFLTRGLVSLPQGNLGAVCGQKQGWKTLGEPGVSKAVKCDNFSLSALTLLLGQQEGQMACKKPSVGLLVVTIYAYSSSCHHNLHHP